MLNDASLNAIGLLVLAWLVYFGLHSLLASLALKRWVARDAPGLDARLPVVLQHLCRVLLLPPLVLTYMDTGPWLWEWTGVGWWVANGLAAAAAFGVLWSLRWYDGSEFLGLRQWRGGLRAAEDQERLPPLAAAPLRAPPLVQPGPGAGLDPGHGPAFLDHGGDDHALLRAGITAGGAQAAHLSRRAVSTLPAAGAGLVPLPWKIPDSRRAGELMAARSAERSIETRTGRR